MREGLACDLSVADAGRTVERWPGWSIWVASWSWSRRIRRRAGPVTSLPGLILSRLSGWGSLLVPGRGGRRRWRGCMGCWCGLRRVAITSKLGQFRGESRFTTWAYKFVMFEVSAKVGRHFWRNPGVPLDAEDWDRLPDRFGFDPAQQAEWHDLLGALHRAVDQELTARQRKVFVAIVLNGVPLDALVIELASNRNAIYKTLFDARRKLRAALAANGYVGDD